MYKQEGSHFLAKPATGILANFRSLIIASVSRENSFSSSFILPLDTWGSERLCVCPMSLSPRDHQLITCGSNSSRDPTTFGPNQQFLIEEWDTHPVFRKESCEPGLLAGTPFNSPRSCLYPITHRSQKLHATEEVIDQNWMGEEGRKILGSLFPSTTFWDLTTYS